MSNGGIPVSGGVSGLGTLLHTNLLYAPLLRDTYGNQLPRPAVTLGGSAGATGYEVAFLKDKDPLTYYKSEASASAITCTFDLGSGNTLYVYGICLVGHNLTDVNIVSAKFEGGTTTECLDASHDLTINAATLTPAFHLLVTPATYRYWRVNVTFTSSMALQIGEAFLIGASPLAFARNYDWEAADDIELGQVINDGANGVPRSVTTWERLNKELRFSRINTAQLTALRTATRNGSVIFSPDGADGFAYFGFLRPEGSREASVGQWNALFRFIEAAR